MRESNQFRTLNVSSVGYMVHFMERKGYAAEAKYLSIIRNWRRASDERGLNAETREQFNRDFLEFVLDGLMPWHKQKDFSFKVNRYYIRQYGLYVVT